MRKTKQIIALGLAAALAFSGVTVTPEIKAAEKEQTIGIAADSASGGAASVSGDAAALKKDVDYFNSLYDSFKDNKQAVRVQKHTLGDERAQLEYYAAYVLGKDNSDILYGICDLEKINPEELLILDGKKLSIYDYEFQMMSEGFKAKPSAVIKNTVEVRVKNAKKGLFTVKTKKGKTTSYISYKYTYGKAQKKETYSATGNTYKKNSKKISSKAFKNYVKSYNKQKMVDFESLMMAYYSDGYNYDGYLYLSKNFSLVSGTFGQSIDGTVVMRYDGDDNKDPYKAFGQKETKSGLEKFRVVFGDTEKDWKAFRTRMTDLTEFIRPLKDALTGSDMGVSKNDYLSKKDCTVYGLYFEPEDGAEADYGYNVYVDESGANPVFKSVELFTSAGVVTDWWEFLYDEQADVDGEMYEPGSDAEVYADPDYVKAVDGVVRTLKLDVNGKPVELHTLDSVSFFLYSATGNFSGTVNGKLIDPIKMEANSPNLDEVMKALNPAGENGVYLEPAITDLKWKPSLA